MAEKIDRVGDTCAERELDFVPVEVRVAVLLLVPVLVGNAVRVGNILGSYRRPRCCTGTPWPVSAGPPPRAAATEWLLLSAVSRPGRHVKDKIPNAYNKRRGSI